jgi:hypothetical protein
MSNEIPAGGLLPVTMRLQAYAPGRSFKHEPKRLTNGRGTRIDLAHEGYSRDNVKRGLERRKADRSIMKWMT